MSISIRVHWNWNQQQIPINDGDALAEFIVSTSSSYSVGPEGIQLSSHTCARCSISHCIKLQLIGLSAAMTQQASPQNPPVAQWQGIKLRLTISVSIVTIPEGTDLATYWTGHCLPYLLTWITGKSFCTYDGTRELLIKFPVDSCTLLLRKLTISADWLLTWP